MGKPVRVRLRGPDAELGRVPAADVGRLLLGIERSAANAAASIVRRRLKTGRRPAIIEAATRFRLVRLESGSLVGVLEVPDIEEDEDALPLEAESLGDLAVAKTIA